MSPLNSGLDVRVKDNQRGLKHEEDSRRKAVSVKGFADGGALWQEHGWPLGAGSVQPPPTEWRSPQPYNHKGQNSADNWNELGSRFFSRASRKESSRSRYLEFVLVRPWAENHVTLCPDSWPTELWPKKWALFWAVNFGVICLLSHQKTSRAAYNNPSFLMETCFYLCLAFTVTIPSEEKILNAGT